jgi:predicted RNA-binding Zn ribbon-like protein
MSPASPAPDRHAAALFVGSHPAMDFLNTSYAPQGRPVEVIGDGRAFLAWSVAAGLLDEPGATALRRRLGAKALDALAADARHVRTWVGDWIARWHEAPDDDARADLRRLNALLHRAKSYREIVATDDGLKVEERRHLESAEGVLAAIAEQVATLVVNEKPDLVRRCSGPGCTLWFLDRTKGHRRLFCSAAACGNRAKVAAFRDRQRG